MTRGQARDETLMEWTQSAEPLRLERDWASSRDSDTWLSGQGEGAEVGSDCVRDGTDGAVRVYILF